MKVEIITPRLTETQFQTLTEYCWLMNMAKCDYVSGITSNDRKTVFGIYNELGFGVQNPNCNSCVIKALKRLASIYDNEVILRAQEGISVEDKPIKSQKCKKKTAK